MTTTNTPDALEEAVAQWRTAADQVLEIAEAAAPKSEDNFETLSFEPVGREAGPVPAEDAVADRVQRYLDNADSLIAQIESAPAGDLPSSSLDDALPVLLSGIDLSSALLAASESPEESAKTLDVAVGGPVYLAGTRQVLDEYGRAVLGTAQVATFQLPDGLTENLEKLETEGAEELIEIGKDAALTGALQYVAEAGIAHTSPAVQKAFEWVKSEVHWLKAQALKILKWVVDKLRSLMPESFRDEFDEKVDDLQDKLGGSAETALGDALGSLFGRKGSEEAWIKAGTEGKDLKDAESKIAGVIEQHLTRLGYEAHARKVAGTAAGIIAKLLSMAGAAVHVQVVLAALALALAGFVCAQLYDGFGDLKDLVTA